MRYQGTVVDASAVALSEVVAALSHALDITEGQPVGHAARSCVIGMFLARRAGVDLADLPALFYGLLLKDLGCSSNASKVCYLFGADDRVTKCDLKTTDWSKTTESVKYVARNVAPDGSLLRKASRFLAVATAGPNTARDLVKMRCERGADIARQLQLPEATAQAIRSLDEHWDGTGHPAGLRGDQIPLLARVMGLAQTAEVFWQKGGFDAARDVVVARSGAWFDPELARAFASMGDDAAFQRAMASGDPAAEAATLEPAGDTLLADDDALDRLAEGFGQVIDAKSAWTFCHSTGVADVACGIGRVLGLSEARQRDLRRAALLHDIGKLGVSNLILDKPGKLSPDELAVMRRHPSHTHAILKRAKCFDRIAEMAAGHHERMDGNGYHRGVAAGTLGLEVRILAVADMYEALAAKRPYRQDLTREEVFTIVDKATGAGLCPAVVAALKNFIAESGFVPHQVAA